MDRVFLQPKQPTVEGTCVVLSNVSVVECQALHSLAGDDAVEEVGEMQEPINATSDVTNDLQEQGIDPVGDDH